jgi:hypothetical protein
MLYMLKDSDSAKFSNVTVRATNLRHCDARMRDGEMRRSKGAYAGFAQFTDTSEKAVAKLWTMILRRRSYILAPSWGM